MGTHSGFCLWRPGTVLESWTWTQHLSLSDWWKHNWPFTVCGFSSHQLCVCRCCMHSFRPSSALSSGYHDIRFSIQTWIYCDKCHLLILIPHERIIEVTPQQECLILSFLPDILSSLVCATFISGYISVFHTTLGCFLKVWTSGQRFLWMETLQKAKVMFSLINATMTSDVFGWLLERKKKKQQCCRRGKVSAAVHV